MEERIITPENCNSFMSDTMDSTQQMADAWNVVCNFCLQKNMKFVGTGRSGIEDVIFFINEKCIAADKENE